MTEAGNAERNIERAMVRPTQLVWYVIGLILSFMAVAPLFWMALAFTLLFLTLHLAAMRNEIMRRRVRTLLLTQAERA